MRAIGLTRFGAPEVLEVLDLPEPHAGPGELRVRVHAAAVNPADVLLRSGTESRYFGERPAAFPRVPGMDAAGVLDEIGAGVWRDLKVGDRVMAVVLPDRTHGAYAEYVVLPAASVVRSPAGVSDAEAATVPMNALTARAALDRLELEPGQVLAVTGAAGAMGSYAIQSAKADALVVVADAAARDKQLIASLGADLVLERGDDFAQRVRAAFPEGVHGVVDGALLNERMAPAVRDGGRIATLRMHTGEAERGISFYPVLVSDRILDTAALEDIRRRVEQGVLTPRIAREFPAESAAQAHALLEAGGVRGRIVLHL